MARLTSSLLLAALLVGTLASASPLARRMLVSDEDSPQLPSSLVEEGASAWVEKGRQSRVAADLAPVFLALQGDAALLDGALACAEATGIAAIASDLPQLLLRAVQGFRTYGFCAMSTQEEQAGRLSSMLSQAVSIHLRDVLLTEYSCEGMASLPEQCAFASLVEAPLQVAVEAKGGALLCADVATDGAADREEVPVLQLPGDWAAVEPVFQCRERA